MLEVSASKSVALGSRMRVSRDMSKLMRRSPLWPARTAKGLGVPLGGGRRRSVVVPSRHMKAVRQRLDNLWTFRRAGDDEVMHVRTARILAIVYGADVMGVVDSRLQAMRSLVARAASPEARGRHPDLVFHDLDADGGTIDPTIAVYCLPISAWACAWWERWVLHDEIEDAYAGAIASLGTVMDSLRHRVAGPTPAVVATARRIGC